MRERRQRRRLGKGSLVPAKRDVPGYSHCLRRDAITVCRLHVA